MKDIDNIYMLVYFRHYYFLWSTWHVIFSHTIFQIALNICHKAFLQSGQIKPHLSILTNVDNSRDNLRQSVQICCKEEEREYWQLQSFFRNMQTQ